MGRELDHFGLIPAAARIHRTSAHDLDALDPDRRVAATCSGPVHSEHVPTSLNRHDRVQQPADILPSPFIVRLLSVKQRQELRQSFGGLVIPVD